jgi:hypothetical protein
MENWLAKCFKPVPVEESALLNTKREIIDDMRSLRPGEVAVYEVGRRKEEFVVMRREDLEHIANRAGLTLKCR